MTLGFYDFLDGLDGGGRRAPRRDAAGLQGDGRGAVRGRAREGRVRHRDAVARDQHAGEDRGDRGPVEVPGRAARAAHARASTRSSPVAPGGGASTRSGTRSWCTSARSRSSAWPGSPRRGPTTSTSSFRPSYNMAVNLVRNYTREQAHHLLNSSFAQFLADRGVVALERQRERDREALDGLPGEPARATSGDFEEYWGLLREARAAPRGGPAGPGARRACEAIRTARRRAPARRRHPRPAGRDGAGWPWCCRPATAGRRCSSQDRPYFRLAARDFDEPPAVLTRIALPRSGSARSARYRRDVAAGSWRST